MNIAVLMGDLQFESQQEIVSSIWRYVKGEDGNLFLFLANPTGKAEHNYGEMKIFDLPRFQDYDGIIYLEGTIPDGEMRSQLTNKLRQENVPYICLNASAPNMPSVYLDNMTAMDGMITHLAEKHGIRMINFIAGPRNKRDAEERLDAVRASCERLHLPLSNKQIYYGDFHAESGMAAVRHFENSMLARPDAYVCANDEMALGAYMQLQEYGIRVPEEVILTGFDNVFAARNHAPRITSVYRDNEAIGRLLYENLLKIIHGKQYDQNACAGCAPVYAESCGCPMRREDSDEAIINSYSWGMIRQNLQINMMRSSLSEFMELNSLRELLLCVKRHVLEMDPDGFFLCLNGSDENSRRGSEAPEGKLQMGVHTEYVDHMSIPVIYTNHRFGASRDVARGDIIPREFVHRGKGVFYLVQPLHFLDRNYGYCVISSDRKPVIGLDWQFFVMNICDSMENIRKQELLVSMVEKLKKVWVYDNLTGVYNRAGFDKYAERILEEAKMRRKSVFVLFLDLDHLKRVNDEYGHKEGDRMIRAIADILKESHRHGELLMRYGGDEFVILGSGYTKETADEYLAEIHAAIDAYNQENDNRFGALSASIGYELEMDASRVQLDRMISEADQKMYEAKKEKRRT